MKKLAYIFGIALFLFGCGASYHIVDVSYNPINPIDPPRQFFTPKDKQPILYIDPVIDNRELAVKMAAPPVFTYYKSGRFEEDPTLIQHFDHGILDNFWKGILFLDLPDDVTERRTASRFHRRIPRTASVRSTPVRRFCQHGKDPFVIFAQGGYANIVRRSRNVAVTRRIKLL